MNQVIAVSPIKKVASDLQINSFKSIEHLQTEDNSYFYSRAIFSNSSNLFSKLFYKKSHSLLIIKQNKSIGIAFAVSEQEFPLKNSIPKLEKQIQLCNIKKLTQSGSKLQIQFNTYEKPWTFKFFEKQQTLSKAWSNIITNQIKRLQKQGIKSSKPNEVDQNNAFIEENQIKDNEENIVQNHLNANVPSEQILIYLKSTYKAQDQKIKFQRRIIQELQQKTQCLRNINQIIQKQKNDALEKNLFNEINIKQMINEIEKLRYAQIVKMETPVNNNQSENFLSQRNVHQNKFLLDEKYILKIISNDQRIQNQVIQQSFDIQEKNDRLEIEQISMLNKIERLEEKYTSLSTENKSLKAKYVQNLHQLNALKVEKLLAQKKIEENRISIDFEYISNLQVERQQLKLEKKNYKNKTKSLLTEQMIQTIVQLMQI